MLLSFVIPTYNAGATLAECVGSVASTPDVEVIVVDDGSADDTLAIACRLAERYASVKVVTQPHGGVSVARNRGIDCAAGEWIAFADADDRFAPGAVDAIRSLIAENRQAQMVAWEYRVATGDDRAVTLHDANGPVAVWQIAVKKSALAIRFTPETTLGEDLEFIDKLLLTLPEEAAIAIADAQYYIYDSHTAAVNSYERALALLDVCSRVLDFAAERGCSFAPRKAANAPMAFDPDERIYRHLVDALVCLTKADNLTSEQRREAAGRLRSACAKARQLGLKAARRPLIRLSAVSLPLTLRVLALKLARNK